MSEYRYKAFISYSHVDESWARWLHRALESYRVPRKLVGSTTRVGEVPARIMPVFRDRDELSSASDLSNIVTTALSESENLIVVCSPNAAASHWVKEEIREFTRQGRKDRIFCLIVDGEADENGSVAPLFPDAIAEAGLDEPLAADARKWADGRTLAKLKLVAGMLGLPLDQLRRRELQKRRKIWALISAASIALLAIVFIAVKAQIAADQRRDSGETLVALKLNELRTMLGNAGNPEDLQRLKGWDEMELAELVASAGTKKENLIRTAQNLRGSGIDLWDSGDVTAAMDRFNDSWALYAEAYRQDRSDQEVFFELGQAEYWIGQVHLDLGELDLAENACLSYAEITRRLIQQQPEKAEWVLEMAYALTNLGRVQVARDEFDPVRILQYMQSALEYNQIALVLDPENEYYRSELGQSYAYLADAQRGVCDLEGALESRQQGVDIEASLLDANDEDQDRQLDMAFAFTGQARVQAFLGQNDKARENYLKAVDLIEQVHRLNPGMRTTRMIAERNNLVIWLDAMSGRIDEAWAKSGKLSAEWQTVSREAGLDNIYTLIAYSTHLIDRAWIASQKGETAMAEDLLKQGLANLAGEARRLPHNRDIGNALTLAVYRHWEIKGHLPPGEILSLLPDYSAYNGRTRSCTDASRAVSKAVMLGDPSEAEGLVTYLLNQGYRESGFMHLCEKYYSCSGQ